MNPEPGASGGSPSTSPTATVARLLEKTGSRWQNVRLVQLGEKAWIALHRSADNRRVPLPEFRANLHAMVKEARAGGAQPVLITAPISHEKGKEPAYLKGIWIKNLAELVPLHQQYVDAVREVGKEDKAVVCDLAAEFAAIPSERRVGLFLKDGIHFNRHGAQRAAGLLAGCLEGAGEGGR